MSEALKWWNSLTDAGRAEFPEPESEEDIENYYDDPASHICMDYGMIEF